MPTSAESLKNQESSRKTSISALLTLPKPLTLWITTNWKILQEMGIHCLLRNLYGGQEATVRTGHETTDWFQIGKGVRQGCILSPCLFNICRVHHEKRWTGRNTSCNQDGREKFYNLRYADDTTLMAESEEELKKPLDESQRGE